MKRIPYVVIVCLFFSSCARNFYGGAVYPDYNLAQKIVDGKVVRKAEGQASTKLILGIGGFLHHRLLYDAMENI